MLKKCFLEKRLRVGIYLILLGTSLIAQAEKSKLILSPEDVNALIPQIEAAERKLLNIKIKSEAWWETKTDLYDPCEPWQRTPVYTSCTAWFGGCPRNKARVDVHKQVLKWIDGAAPYIEESYSVGFDGRHGRIAYRTTKHSGRTRYAKEGELLSGAPPRLVSTDVPTGAKFSLYSFFDEEGYTFSQFFKAAISPAALEAKAFEVAIEEFQGVECIKFGSGEQTWGHISISWWLDPSRGFALLGHDNIRIREDGSERVSTRIRVTKLKEAAPGVWWPTEAYGESGLSKPGEPYSRTVYRASSVVANDPNFDEAIFTVPFPEGYLIDDQIAGKKYKVGPDGKQLTIPDSNEPNQLP